MHRRFSLLLVAGVLILAGLGCSVLSASSPATGAEVEPAAPAEDQTEQQPPAASLPACDQRATPIETGGRLNLQMHSTTSPYPANCLYYCVGIAEGGDRLDIAIRDFDVDLDLFVGYGSFEAVSGDVPVEGESYTWKSNDYGTDDEEVSVSNPEAGLYYIEVCSYAGESSPFVLETDVR